jgi:hypothetical protein
MRPDPDEDFDLPFRREERQELLDRPHCLCGGPVERNGQMHPDCSREFFGMSRPCKGCEELAPPWCDWCDRCRREHGYGE